MPTKTTTTKKPKETAAKDGTTSQTRTRATSRASSGTTSGTTAGANSGAKQPASPRAGSRAIDALNAPRKLARKKDELAAIAPDSGETVPKPRRRTAKPAAETPAQDVADVGDIAEETPAPAVSRRGAAKAVESAPAPTPVVQAKPTVVAPPAAVVPSAPREATWYRIDLHMHTPASHDYEQPEKSYLDILKQAEKRGLNMIAFTDHNSANGYRNMLREISDLEMLERLDRIRADELARLEEFRRLLKKIVVLPGFEFTATFGFHILGIFPPDKPLREIENVLVQLRVPSMAIDLGLTEAGATSDVLTAYRLIDEAGGIAIAAHANSSNGVSMRGLNLGGQTRISFTQDPHLHAIEFTDLDRGRRSSAMLFRGTRAEYPRIMHVLQGSDAHRIAIDVKNPKRLGIGERPTEVELPTLSFAALRELFLSQDYDRVRPAHMAEIKETTDGLQAARIAGESATVAFHATLPKRAEKRATRGKAKAVETSTVDDTLYDAILRDVCAMANGAGGHVYIGCEANLRKKAVGVPEGTATSELSEAIYRQIHPAINCAISTQLVDGDRTVMAIRVSPSEKAPFTYQSLFWVRDAATTRVGTRDEIVGIVRRVVEQNLAASNARAASAQPAPVQNQPHQRRQPHPRNERDGSRDGAREGVREGARESDRDERNQRDSRNDQQRDQQRDLPRDQQRPLQQRPHQDRNARDNRNQPNRQNQPGQTGQTNTSQPNPQPQQRGNERGGERGNERVNERVNERTPAQQQVQPQTQQRPAERPAERATERPAEQTTPPPAAETQPVKPAESTANPTSARRSFVEELQAAQARLAADARNVRTNEAPAQASTQSPAQPAQKAPAQQSSNAERTPERHAERNPDRASDRPQTQPANGNAGASARVEGAPRNGVQVLGMEERDGVVYFTVRDVRNNTLVRNVTLKSARDLWHYAITQHADNPDGPEDLEWQGNKAVASKALRAGKMRYDLAVRDADDNVRMFYGVTDDGLNDEWRSLVADFGDDQADDDDNDDNNLDDAAEVESEENLEITD